MVASSMGWGHWPKMVQVIYALPQVSQIKTHAMLAMTQRSKDQMKKLSFASANLTKTCSTASISWIWRWCLDWRTVVWPMTRQDLSYCGNLTQMGRHSIWSPSSNETLMCSDSQLYKRHCIPLRRQGSQELHHASRGPVWVPFCNKAAPTILLTLLSGRSWGHHCNKSLAAKSLAALNVQSKAASDNNPTLKTKRSQASSPKRA